MRLPTITTTDAPCWHLLDDGEPLDTGFVIAHYPTQQQADEATQRFPGTIPARLPTRCVMLTCACGEPVDDTAGHFESRAEAIAYAIDSGWHAREGYLFCPHCAATDQV